MNQHRWGQIEELFNFVVELPREDRESYLKKICSEDNDLGDEVRSLLEENDTHENFLEDNILPAGFSLLAEGKEGITLLEGQKIGTYQIIRFLGNGGMGAVYL